MWITEVAEMEAIPEEGSVTEMGNVRFEDDGEKPKIQ